jgi:hypothetical protein
MTKPEKLTVVLDQPVADELAAWAREEDRPVSNLLRRIVTRSIEQRRQSQQASEAA